MSTQDHERPDPFADMSVPKALGYIGLQALSFTAIGLALWVLADRKRLDFVTLSGAEALSGLVLAAVLIAISVVLAKAFPRYAEWLIRTQARNYGFLRHRISIGAIVFISLCAGIGEEALFRGGLQTVLGDWLPMPVALTLASALFAAIHFAKPLNSALIFVIGCLFGLVYWRTGSLLTVMIGHAVYDIYALWALQEALHKLGVFEEDKSPTHLPAHAPRETLEIREDTKGESP
ncbi:MAG: type II CAAX endopeptidase family protein [Erythrobacter sp.]|uniref:CPBP family intramembrane glutamic endopeptidase n=1 Tax=Erythrobacter sp. TaxID=1042 RepID=UPI0026100B62|nr:type II CAAX endopeptidase family protein [Erythrobacter sp.]MDJ0977673.1 type II CAAX endopeptidase family protein [Erythrobacter sp.]